MKYYRKTFANINLRNLSHNFGEIKKAIGEKSFICPMVKANAYGHGAVEITNRLINDGAKQVGVCLIEEALELRQAGIKIPILTFDIFDRDAAEAILEHELTPVISCWQQLEVLKEFCKKKRKHCRIHLKFNTGMSRLGFGLAEAEKLAATFSDKELILEGVCSHFSHGEDAAQSDGFSQIQLGKIEKLKSIFSDKKIIFHLHNSAAIFSYSHSRAYGARPGIALYGALDGEQKLKPVMSIVSQVALCRYVEKNESVSYGGKWTATKKSVIAVVPFGYEDGYFRSFSNTSYMLFRGQKARVVGTVCMDYSMIDITDITGGSLCEQGEEVVVLGPQGQQEINASQLAQWANTISYEVLTSVGQRVPRIYKS